jgi:hypothetical protein
MRSPRTLTSLSSFLHFTNGVTLIYTSQRSQGRSPNGVTFTPAQPGNFHMHTTLSFFLPAFHFGQVVREALVKLFSYLAFHSFCFSKIK